MAINTKQKRHVALLDQGVIFPDSPGNLDTAVQRANALQHYYDATPVTPPVALPGAGSIDNTLDSDFYGGMSGVASADALSGFNVALDGRPYLIDLKLYEETILDSATPQTDDAAEAGEKALSRSGFWDREQTDWSLGAGQELFDVAGASRSRYHESMFTNPWVPGQISLLHDTALRRSSTLPTNLKVYAVGGLLYFVDDDILRYTADPNVEVPTFSSTAAQPADITSITSDGNRVFIAFGGATAVRVGNINSTTFAAFGAETPSLVHYTNGRLFAATTVEIYELSSAGAKTTIKTDARSGWLWKAIAGMPSAVFAAGAVNDVSEIFAIAVDPDTGGLLPPVWAGGLPYGETVQCMVGYPPAGVVVIGTNKGVRAARVNGTELAIGERIDIPGGVTALAVRDRFCWFTWTNADAENTGLGRLDLSVSTSPATHVPAYALDLLARNTQGTVSSVALFGDRAYFTVLGSPNGGLWGETEYLVPAGFVRGGRIRFGVLADKIFTGVQVRHDPLDGTLSASIEFDDFTTHSIGVGGAAGSVVTTFDDAGAAGLSACPRLGLIRSDGDPLLGPIVRSFVQHALPRPKRVIEFVLPILMRTKVDNLRGLEEHFDPLPETRALKTLASSLQLVLFQMGEDSYSVRVMSVAIPSGSVRSWINNEHGQVATWLEATVFVRLLSKEA